MVFGPKKVATIRERFGKRFLPDACVQAENNATKNVGTRIAFGGYSSVPIQETTSMTTLVLVCLSMVTAAEWGTLSRLCPSTANRRSPHFSFPS